jgi:hypothetical protein
MSVMADAHSTDALAIALLDLVSDEHLGALTRQDLVTLTRAAAGLLLTIAHPDEQLAAASVRIIGELHRVARQSPVAA